MDQPDVRQLIATAEDFVNNNVTRPDARWRTTDENWGRAQQVSSWLQKKWFWFAVLAGLFFIWTVVSPGAAFFWDYPGFKVLLHDHLGIGQAWSSIAAIVITLFYVLAFPPAVSWLFFGSRRFTTRIKAFVAVMVVFGTTPLLHALFDTNFNQASGKAQKWYIRDATGHVVLSDSGGFDPALGVERRPITPDVARAIERDRRGIRPKPVSEDPRRITFFDPVTGHPRIWYHGTSDGQVKLFDSEGFYPGSGDILQPITSNIAAALREGAAEAEQKLELEKKVEAARLEAEARDSADREEAEAKKRENIKLVKLVGTDTYSIDTVVIGAKPVRRSDELSSLAAARLQAGLITNVRSKGVIADAAKSDFVESEHFNRVLHGYTEILTEARLAEKMRAAIVSTVSCSCTQTTSISGLISCNVRSTVRVINKLLINSSISEWSAIGAGANADEAINRAVELIMERHASSLRLNGI